MPHASRGTPGFVAHRYASSSAETCSNEWSEYHGALMGPLRPTLKLSTVALFSVHTSAGDADCLATLHLLTCVCKPKLLFQSRFWDQRVFRSLQHAFHLSPRLFSTVAGLITTFPICIFPPI